MASVRTISSTVGLVAVMSFSACASLSAVAGKVMDQIGLPKVGGQELKFDVESLATAVLRPADGAGQSTVLSAIVAIFALLLSLIHISEPTRPY